MPRKARASRAAIAIGLSVLVVSPMLLALDPTPSVAADAGSFDAGNIISDAVFYDGHGLSTSEIQKLLNERGSACKPAGGLACLKDIRVDISASSSDAYCSTIAAATGVTAAQVFATVGAACGINPAVLVVLVEKEQSLVTRSSPTSYAYRYATGYNCPDTAPCSDVTSGFYRQVYYAARQFERYRLNPSSYNHQAGQYETIAYNPNPACGSSVVLIRNNATAGLYNYTPYQPNAAALRNLYGIGDECSAYGNRNFWRIFTDWFGNTGNLIRSSSFEATLDGWGFGNGHMNRLLRGPTTIAHAGQYFLAANTANPGRSIAQDIRVAPKPGQSYSGAIWLKSGKAGREFSGKLVLWALGGSAENSVTPFTVGDSWTEVKVDLDVVRSGHSRLRFEVYLDSTHFDLNLDLASLTQAPWQAGRGPVALNSPSFEQGLGTWTFKNGFMNRAVYTIPSLAFEGNRFLASNTQYSGRSVGQDIYRVPLAGERFTAILWMRSGHGTRPFDGRLALWALGGSSEVSTTTFTVGQEWTPVAVSLPIEKTGHSRLRLEVYLWSEKYDLRLDDVTVTATLLDGGSFEQGVGRWRPSNGSATIEAVAGTFGPDGTMDGYTAGRAVAATSGSSVANDTARRLEAGGTYTAKVWMRTENPEESFSGRLALWALGGNSQVATSDVVVDGTWREYEVALTTADATNDRLRVELYSSSPGVAVMLDTARLY